MQLVQSDSQTLRLRLGEQFVVAYVSRHVMATRGHEAFVQTELFEFRGTPWRHPLSAHSVRKLGSSLEHEHFVATSGKLAPERAAANAATDDHHVHLVHRFLPSDPAF